MRTKGRRIERGMIVLGVGIVAAAWMAVILAAAPPDRVNYQGVLRDATNHPRTGVFDMVFRLWTAPTAGDEVVVDSHLAAGSGAVAVTGGMFNAVLGGGTVTDGSGPGVYTSLGQAFQNYSPLYLEVAVNGETLSPRTPVNSTPYAVHAHALDGKTSSDFVDVSTSPQTKAGALTVGGRLTVDPHPTTSTALVVSSGNVGIGTPSPALKLDVVGGGIGSDGPITIRVAAGTVPIAVTSTALIPNLNADMVGGLHATDLATASHNHDASYVRKSGDTMLGALTVAPSSVTITAFSALGRVGIGITTATAQVDLRAPAVPGGSEPLVRVSVADDPLSSLTIDNGSSLDGEFATRLRADVGGNVTMSAVSLLGRVGSDVGSRPVVSIDTSTLLGQSLTTRPLFRIDNNAAPVAIVTAPGRVGIGTTTPAQKLDVSGGGIGSDGPITIRVAAGIVPIAVTSTALVPNFNADMVGGLHATDLATASHNHDASYVRKSGDTMLGALTVAPSSVTITAFSALGRVGVGVPTATAQVDIEALAVSGGSEPVLRLSVADAPSSSLRIDNGSTLNGVFQPRLVGGFNPGSVVTLSALVMEGQIGGDTGSQPAVTLRASTAQGQSLTTRPLFRIDNNDAPVVTVSAPGRVGIGTTTPAVALDVEGGGGIRTDGPVEIRVAAGMPPLSLTTTALVANFNADMVGGFHATDFARTSHNHDSSYVRKSGDTMFGALTVEPSVATATAFAVASGNVGIGTTSPGARLDVRTDGDLTGIGGPVVRVSAVDDQSASLVLDDGNSLPGVFLPRLIGTASASPIAVSRTAMAIEGRVPFDNSTQPAVSFSASTVLGDALTVQPLFQFRNHETPVMTVDAQGHVGIGTTTPEVSLDVAGPVRASGPMIISVGAGDMPINVTTTAMVQNLNVEMLGGFHAQDFAPAFHLHEAEYVNAIGDTMTGPLFLPLDALTVGTNPLQPQLAARAGNIGIGTSNPTFNLQTEGFKGGFFKNLGTTNARAYLAGGSGTYLGWGVEAYGLFNNSAGSGGGGFFKDNLTGNSAAVAQNIFKIIGTGNVSFIQNHPYERDKAIIYVAPEGDETAVYTRGKAKLVGGEAHIALGDTFKWVANPDVGLTAYVTPRGEAVPLAVVSLTPSEMVVQGPASGPQDVLFDYIVYGLRIGFEEAGVVVEKHQEAKIPSMVNERARYEARPELRTFNALERFKAAEGMAKGIEASAVDLGQAAALKAAIGEYDPAVDAEAGEPTVTTDLQSLGGGRPGVAAGAGPAQVAAVAGASGAGPASASPQASEQDSYARSFRPSSPELAEFVPVGEAVGAGDVLVADADHPGLMKLATSAADPAVVGIVSRDPGVALGAGKAKIGESDSALARQVEAARARGDEAEANRLWSQLEARFHSTRAPVAFTGIVVCKADSAYGAIRVGDLLTTSPTRGHAMRADHPEPGTVLGKALEPLASGSGLIKVLVMLR